VELLCRSRPATSRQPGRGVSASALSFVDGEAALVMRKTGKWIRLDGPAAASVDDGELLSRVNGARGVFLADAVSSMASSRL
jgi:hypothetical protein